ncbi:MAG: Na+/H+ antiporter subunit E [Planctomycetota bacterium]
MVQYFLLNLFLAVVYITLTGDLSFTGIVFGFLIGGLVTWLVALASGGPNYVVKIWRLFGFGLYFLRILTLANFQIAWEVITPTLHQSPRILRYPVEGLSDIEITVLSNAITLTPGTLVVDVADDRSHIYVHCMYAKDRDKAMADLDELAERLRRGVFS